MSAKSIQDSGKDSPREEIYALGFGNVKRTKEGRRRKKRDYSVEVPVGSLQLDYRMRIQD